MNISFAKLKNLVLVVFVCLISISNFGQSKTNKWKALIAFGFNYPDIDGFVSNFEAKPVNFPTINIGVQHMFTRNMGAKLDYGFNRFSNAEDSSEFKINYGRINAQFVYDATNVLSFLPNQIGLVGHIGPGMSFIKPLGAYGDNKHSLFNTLAGLEIHYNIARTVSAYIDGAYIVNISGGETYDPISKGFGTFNNNLFNITLGISVSLSGCQYCD